MKKLYILFIFLFCVSWVAYGQNSDVTALYAKLDNAKNDEEKVVILLQIADKIAYESSDVAIKYGESALEISNRLGDVEGIVNSMQTIAKANKAKKKFAPALDFYLQATRVCEKNKRKDLLGDVYFDIGRLYQDWNIPDKALEYLNKARATKENVASPEWMNALLSHIGSVHIQIQNYESANEVYLKLLNNYRGGNNNSKLSITLYHLTTINIQLAKYQKALDFNLELLRLRQSNGEDLRGVLNTMGFLYKQVNNYQQAISYFKKALAENRKFSQDELKNVKILTNIGVMQQYVGNHQEALTTFFETLNILERAQEDEQIANTCLYISALYMGLKEFDDALNYADRAIRLGEQDKLYGVLQRAYQRKSEIYEKTGRKNKALDVYKQYVGVKEQALVEEYEKRRKEVENFKEANTKEKEINQLLLDKELQELTVKKLQADAEKKQKDLALVQSQKKLLEKDKNLSSLRLQAEALERSRAEQQLIVAQQEIEAAKQNREISDLQKNQELQRTQLRAKDAEDKQRDRERKLLEQESELHRLRLEEKQNQQYYLYGVIGLCVLIIMVSIVSLYFRNKANKKITLQSQELERHTKTLEGANKTIQRKNEHITSSINYAQTIQQAILPSGRAMQEGLDDFFVIYRPKDIVSGDFYWFSHIPAKEGGHTHDMTFIAVVDCTGHGVPGAFMSMIGNTLLNEIVNHEDVFEPNDILTLLNERTQVALKQNAKSSANSDGMDICLVRLERTSPSQTKVTFAGAKRPLYVYTGTEFMEMKGNRKSIGGYQRHGSNFLEEDYLLDNGSILYLTTDGFADQNDPSRRKIGSRKLKSMLSDNAHLLLFRQKLVLENLLDKHQQDSDQRDDITILGIRL